MKCLPICGKYHPFFGRNSSILFYLLQVAVILFVIGAFLITGSDNLSGILGPLMIIGSFIVAWNGLRKDLPRNLTVSKDAPWYKYSESDCNFHWYPGVNVCKKCGNYID